KIGYVKKEDCHCFCCGSHDGQPQNHSLKKAVNIRDALLSTDTPEDTQLRSLTPSSGVHSQQKKFKGTPCSGEVQVSNPVSADTFILSSKRIKIHDISLNKYWYLKEDVKEFIKRLKEELCSNYRDDEKACNDCESCKEIDKLAGDLK
ncbi:hypothetical protein LCGC14_3104500, partial [marine sediment metagenome]